MRLQKKGEKYGYSWAGTNRVNQLGSIKELSLFGTLYLQEPEWTQLEACVNVVFTNSK